jgi:hypothetical protein
MTESANTGDLVTLAMKHAGVTSNLLRSRLKVGPR